MTYSYSVICSVCIRPIQSYIKDVGASFDWNRSFFMRIIEQAFDFVNILQQMFVWKFIPTSLQVQFSVLLLKIWTNIPISRY